MARYALLIPAVLAALLVAVVLARKQQSRIFWLRDLFLQALGSIVAGSLWFVILLPIYFALK
jgi:hypothetical protein